jgi:peptidoglycan/xylan/chitin deacetylase (PgdA/CDA1 family)
VRRRGLLAAGPLLWGGWTLGAQLLAFGSAWRGSRTAPAVALTFDDGPDPAHTPAVLDCLERAGVGAAFFLIGRRAAAAPDVVRRIADGGHDLGNHTWSHRSLWLAGPGATREEIERGHDAITSAAGRAPRFFRPPWGLANLAMLPILARLGTPAVFWTAQPEARTAVAPDRQLARALGRVRPGAIYDLHDADGVPGAGRRLTAYLPRLIDGLRDAGYALVPLSRLV